MFILTVLLYGAETCGAGGQVPGSLRCSQSVHIAHSKELEAASWSSKAYLAENSKGRPAPIQLRPCVRISEGAE